MVEAHAAGVHPQLAAAAGLAPVAVGNVTLDPVRRILSGPGGEVDLQPGTVAIAMRLMRRARDVVTQDAMVVALYPDPDLEPERPDLVIRKRVQHLRAALLLASEGGVQVRTMRTWAINRGAAMTA